MTKYAYDVEVDQTFSRVKTMRIIAANEDDLAEKVEERTKGDATRLGCKDNYSGTVMYIVDSVELPTAQKY
jgi:hypothetical protein